MNPLVFVHGFMGGGDQWKPQEALAKGRELIRVDLPGFGRNAVLPPINRIELFAEWVRTELGRIGVSRFDLLGHSMGGMVVQEMVHQAPAAVDNLILYGTGAVGVLPDRFESIETSMQRASDEGPESTADRISATWFLDREEARDYPACAEIAKQASLPAILAGLEAMKVWSGEDRLTDIRSRTLILWGEVDRSYSWTQINQLWSSIPNSHLAVVPNCAHAVHLEVPDIFNRLVEQFLTLKNRPLPD